MAPFPAPSRRLLSCQSLHASTSWPSFLQLTFHSIVFGFPCHHCHGRRDYILPPVRKLPINDIDSHTRPIPASAPTMDTSIMLVINSGTIHHSYIFFSKVYLQIISSKYDLKKRVVDTHNEKETEFFLFLRNMSRQKGRRPMKCINVSPKL